MEIKDCGTVPQRFGPSRESWDCALCWTKGSCRMNDPRQTSQRQHSNHKNCIFHKFPTENWGKVEWIQELK